MGKSPKSVEFETDLVKSTTGSNWHFLLVTGEITAKLGFEGKFRRIVCTVNDTQSFQCALLPWGEIFYIIVNKKKRDNLGLVAGDMVKVRLVKDESKYGLPMPEEFQEVLDQDSDGDRLFHALSEGKQRSILYLLSKPKNIDVRIHQALVIISHLKDNGGNIDGKKLYEELKRPIF